LGRVAERFGSTRMMLFCVLACLASCLLLPSAFNSWLIWPLLFVWGGVSFGIYTLSPIHHTKAKAALPAIRAWPVKRSPSWIS
ncbi:hypothetical protein ACEQ6A_35505, partial [Rhizobium brockwellii]